MIYFAAYAVLTLLIFTLTAFVVKWIMFKSAEEIHYPKIKKDKSESVLPLIWREDHNPSILDFDRRELKDMQKERDALKQRIKELERELEQTKS